MNQQLNTIDRLLTAFQQRLGKTRSKTEVSVLSGVVVDAHKVVEFNGRSNAIAYVEKLICLPSSDHRKFAISLILAPYCINIKHMTINDSVQTIRQWALRSDKLRKLEPSMDYFDRLISSAIKRCTQNPNIKPLNFGNTLKQKNMALYALLL